MSEGFTVSPAPAARTRPTTVTVANALLLVVAASFVIGFVLALSIIGTMRDVFEEEFAGTEAEGFEGVAIGFAIGASSINLLIAIGLVVLAVFNNRGSNPSRIVTWVVGGIGLCCNGIGLAFSGANAPGSGGDVDQDELERRLTEELPSWLESVNLTLGVVGLLALAVALILLALPPSNEFFRKREEPFEPPPAYPPPA